MTVLSVRIEDNTNKWLEKVSRQKKSSKSSFIRDIINAYKEDQEDGQIALKRLNKKNSRYLTTEEMERSLGL